MRLARASRPGLGHGLRLLTALVGLAFLVGPVAEADQGPIELPVAGVDASAFPRVAVELSPPRELGDVDVPAGAFRVVDEDTTSQPEVTRLPSEQLQLALVIDTSEAMTGASLRAAQAAAAELLLQLPTDASVAVVAAGDQPVVLHRLAPGPGAALPALAGLQAGGRHALHDALGVAVAQFGERPQARPTVLALTASPDSASGADLKSTADLLAQRQVSLFAVHLTDTGGVDTADALETLARAYGGRVDWADEPDQVVGLFLRVAEELDNQYRLTYFAGLPGSIATVELDHRGVEASADLSASGGTAVQAPDRRGGRGIWSRWGTTIVLGSLALMIALWDVRSPGRTRRRPPRPRPALGRRPSA